MTEQTPRNKFPYPSFREQPHYDSFKQGILQEDAAHWAHAVNHNTLFRGGGAFGFDATANIVFWTQDLLVSGFETGFTALIGSASVEIEDGEVIYFKMPRQFLSNITIPVGDILKSNRIFSDTTKQHDLLLLAKRDGDTVYFPDGKSLKDGETGILYGGGLGPSAIVIPHEHLPPLVVEPPTAGVGSIDALVTAPDLVRVDLYRNGFLQVSPDDFTLDLGTGIITLVSPTTSGSERFVLLRETRDFVSSYTSHSHLSTLVINPPGAGTTLDVLVTSPTLDGVDLFRNGAIQVEPDDYSLDTGTGFITVVNPYALGERFVVHRRISI